MDQAKNNYKLSKKPNVEILKSMEENRVELERQDVIQEVLTT